MKKSRIYTGFLNDGNKVMHGKKILVFLLMCVYGAAVSSVKARTDPAERSISLMAADMPLRMVLRDIAEQARVRFIFCDEHIDGVMVTCRLDSTTLPAGLKTILNNTGLDWRLMPEDAVVIFKDSPLPASSSVRTADTPFNANRMRPPVPAGMIVPYYPVVAKNEGLEGRVGIEMLISGEGKVKDVRIAVPSGYEILDQAARTFAFQLKFQPAMQGDRPVDIWISRNFNYTLEERTLSPGNYVETILSCRRQLKSADSSGRSGILRHILQTHNQYCLLLSERGTTFNSSIPDTLLLPGTAAALTTWNSEQSFCFLVFHDFIKRYPQTDVRADAAGKLEYFARLKIQEIRDSAVTGPQEKAAHDRSVDELCAFLEEEHSIHIHGSRRP